MLFSDYNYSTHCKKVVTTEQIGKHYKSKACLDGKTHTVKQTNCKYCSISFEGFTVSDIANHSRWCNKNPDRKQKQKKIKICSECGTTYSNRNKYCSKECANKQSSKPENRLKTSNAGKHYLKNNPEKHPWKRHDKYISKPCETLKQYLRNKDIKFIEEWQPLEDRFFSIDIAFPDIKLGIEVNGNQHYNRDGTLAPYYQERHDLIEAAGWKLIELHYTSCYVAEVIDTVIDIKEQPDYSEYFRAKEEKSNSRKRKTKSPT